MNVITWILRTIDDERLIYDLFLNLTIHEINVILAYLDYEDIEIQQRWISVYNEIFTFS